MDINESILNDLKALAKGKVKAFTAKLLPTIDGDRILGLYTPEVKSVAKKYADNEHIGDFLSRLPHYYLEQNTLHALIICGIKSYDECVKRLDEFLPYVDNWATCDSMRPKVFSKNLTRAKADALRWINSDKPFTVRFGAEVVMTYFLGDKFDFELAEAVKNIKSDHYYVNMMVAWYFATALCKNRDYAMGVIKSGVLDKFTHNMAIRKAIESFRVSEEDKLILKTLKMQ